ncbi:MAG: PilZ domain-containing protein [Gammaproteobacteria bacterium]|nr:PilZ domain-containing protein [Gammaproteobacteria bacterium]
MSSSETDQRKFFRIKDNVQISIETLAYGKKLSDLKADQTSFLLGSAISALDLEAQMLLNRIKRNTADIASYFEIINKKIDLISTHIIETSPQSSNQLVTEIDLSASGIAIKTNNSFSEQDLVMIKLLLLPEMKGIICTGRVIRIKQEDSTKTLCIDFVEISEADREIIIKHTISKQLEEARFKHQLNE